MSLEDACTGPTKTAGMCSPCMHRENRNMWMQECRQVYRPGGCGCFGVRRVAAHPCPPCGPRRPWRWPCRRWSPECPWPRPWPAAPCPGSARTAARPSPERSAGIPCPPPWPVLPCPGPVQRCPAGPQVTSAGGQEYGSTPAQCWLDACHFEVSSGAGE